MSTTAVLRKRPDFDRGSRITAINGQSVESLIAAGTIGSAFGASEIGIQSNIVFFTRGGARREAQMTKRLVTIPTVSLTSVFNVDGRKVGYLHFRNFVRPSIAALDQAFETLKQSGVTELVLDLRYNGGGLVDVAVHLASLIGGSLTSGQVLAVYDHNDKNQRYNETLRFENPSQALNLDRLVVITTRATASASELIVNSLRPYIPVATIGETTYGKPVGQYGVPFCTKVLAPVAFSLKNASGEGDYFDGLAPTCAAVRRHHSRIGRRRRVVVCRSHHVSSDRPLQRPGGEHGTEPARRPASRAALHRIPGARERLVMA